MSFIKKRWYFFVIAFYGVLHLIKLECFPFYLFAMYSQAAPFNTQFISYEVRIDGEACDLSLLNYRQRIYLNNTLEAYDAIKSHPEQVLPDSKIIMKYYKFIGLSTMASHMESKYRYVELEALMTDWMIRFFKIQNGEVSIIRKSFNWQKDNYPIEVSSELILP